MSAKPMPTSEKPAPNRKPDRIRKNRKGYRIFHNAASFPGELRSRLRELLVEGFTVQSATRYINQDPDARWGVKEAAAEEFARSDKQLPAERVAYMAETTEAIITGLGGGQEGDNRYARAVIRTGLLHLHEGDTSLTMNQALLQRRQMEIIYEQRAHINAKRRLLVEQAKVRQEESKLIKAREIFIQVQTTELRQAVHKFEKKRNITPETIREIREVYGLIHDNVAQLNATPVVVERALPAKGEVEDDDPIYYPSDHPLIDPQAEIQKHMIERARMMNALPLEQLESGEWQVPKEKTSLVIGPSSVVPEAVTSEECRVTSEEEPAAASSGGRADAGVGLPGGSASKEADVEPPSEGEPKT